MVFGEGKENMRVLYTIGILLYSLGVRLAALFGHAKAMKWVEGRRKQGSLSPSKGPIHSFAALRQAQGPRYPRFSYKQSKSAPTRRHAKR